MVKKIYLGADHAGFRLKEEIKTFLAKKKISFEDLGNYKLDKKDDYPIYAARVAKKVAKEKSSGILICGSGQGVAIAANKMKGIRAVVAENVRDAFLARRDDDANVLALQGRYIKRKKAEAIIKKFVETKFAQKERYKRRIKEIKRLE